MRPYDYICMYCDLHNANLSKPTYGMLFVKLTFEMTTVRWLWHTFSTREQIRCTWGSVEVFETDNVSTHTYLHRCYSANMNTVYTSTTRNVVLIKIRCNGDILNCKYATYVMLSLKCKLSSYIRYMWEQQFNLIRIFSMNYISWINISKWNCGVHLFTIYHIFMLP